MLCAAVVFLAVSLFVPVAPLPSAGQKNIPDAPPLRVAVVGLVHGHVEGFFAHHLRRSDIQIVGIADPNRQLFDRYGRQFSLDPKVYFSSIDELLVKVHPQAVVVYTNTLDHRKVVEICARQGIHVMMEKPLAVSLDDAHAIAIAARQGKIHVLVNYETTWYRSNHAAYDLVRQGAIGEVRKIVVHDGHRGPKEIGVSPEFLVWLTDPKLNGAGALFDFGCYGADLATWLMNGKRPLTVTAVTQTIKPDIYPRVDDEATIILTYPKTQAIIQASWNWPFDRKDMEVYAQTGYVFTVARDEVRVRLASADEQRSAGKPLVPPYDDPLTELRAVLLDNAKPDILTSLNANMVVMEILDAARRSAATGKTIHLANLQAPAQL